MITRLLWCLFPAILTYLAAYASPAPSRDHTEQTTSATTLGPPPPSVGHGPDTLGQITSPEIREASGLAISQRSPEILWTHNDSGNEPVLYAIDTSGQYLGSVRIEGAVNRDWEDIASYEIDGQPYLIVGDIGDNEALYPECVLYIIAEPELAKHAHTRELTATPEHIIRYVYPGGPRDCESLAIDTSEQAIYLITKRIDPPILYRLPLFSEDSNHPLVAEEIGPVNGIPQPSGLLSQMPVPWGKWRALACSLDISSDGKRTAILTYGEVYLYDRRDSDDWATTFARGGQSLVAHNLPQAEGLCFSPDGQTLYVTTEGSPAPLIGYTLPPHTDTAEQ